MKKAALLAMMVLDASLATAAAAGEPKRIEVLRSPVEGLPSHQGAISTVEMPPESATGKHSHPGQEYVYVVNGAVILEAQGAAPVTLGAGQALVIPANQVHVARNASKTEAAKVVVVGLVPNGKEATVPAE
jgi:quercetin dioxygenase-like cupin family protein